jgi:hypothetical protein
MMWGIFTEDLKNTRFILTVLALGLLGFFGIAILYLIQTTKGSTKTEIPEGLMALLTTLVGAIIAIVSVAYNSHFKAREEDAAVRAAAAATAATAAENAAVGTTIAENTAVGTTTAEKATVGAATAENTAVGTTNAENAAVKAANAETSAT